MINIRDNGDIVTVSTEKPLRGLVNIPFRFFG